MATRFKLTLFALVTATPSLVYAQSATTEKETAQLEEIVITAQKRTERLQDIPVSASVVSTEAINQSNAGDISDLNRLVPSVMLSGSFNGRVPTGMRGISSVSNEGTIGLSSGVAIMIDGVPVPSDSRAGNNHDDAANVEVLKGPQATLGGRTAAAGVINVVTRRPTDTLQGEASLTATNDHEYRANGYVSGPITDKVKYSLAGYYTTREYPIKNLITGDKSEQRVYGLRGKLLFQPTEDLDIMLMARYARDHADGANFVYIHTTPGANLLLGTALPPPGSPPRLFLDSVLSQPVILPGITPNWENQSYTSAANVPDRVKDTDYSLDVQYRIGDLTLGSTTAYQHETQNNQQDLFLTNTYWWNNLTNPTGTDPNAPPPFFNAQNTLIDIKQLSEELKLVSPTDRDFSYLVGLFYSDTKIDGVYNRPFVPAWQLTDTNSRTKTTDVYARGTWKFGASNSLVVGLRYNHDRISYDYAATFFPPPPVTQILNYGDSSSESTVVGDISFQHKFGDNQMAYLTYARGYSPSAYNTAFVQYVTPAAPDLGTASKENIDHFELGSKGTYLNGRLSLNASLFYTKYKDFQVQIFDASTVSLAPPLRLANAGGAETKGLELDARLAATDHLTLGLSAAYIDAKFTDYKGAPCYYGDVSGIVPVGSACFQDVNGNSVRDSGEAGPGDPITGISRVVQDLSGARMPISPKLKFMFDAQQRIALGGDYEVVLAGNYSWRDKAQMLVDQNPYGVQKSFGILNLSIGFQKRGGKLSATLFCNNVTDENYYTDVEDFWSAPWGGTNTIVGQPARDANRYFGLRLNAGF